MIPHCEFCGDEITDANGPRKVGEHTDDVAITGCRGQAVFFHTSPGIAVPSHACDRCQDALQDCADELGRDARDASLLTAMNGASS